MRNEAIDRQELEATDQMMLTFRVLRCAVVGASLVLGVALVIEALRAGQIRGSISAYFYSPVRSIFVGCLMAIGLCLLAIQGRTVVEDALLNIAGLCAFAVALVPIRPEACVISLPTKSTTLEANATTPEWLGKLLKQVSGGTCRLSAVDGGSSDGLPAWVVTGIRNNVLSVMLVTVVALVAILALRKFPHSQSMAARQSARAGTWAIGIYVVLLAIGSFLYLRFDGQRSTSHYFAACAMFAIFGAVVVIYGWIRDGVPRTFRITYRVVAVLMVIALPLGLLTSVYWLEAAEMALFAVFWTAQTVQIWDPRSERAKAMIPSRAEMAP